MVLGHRSPFRRFLEGLIRFDKVVVPALTKYQPEMIFVASGFDASIVDPLARMMCHGV